MHNAVDIVDIVLLGFVSCALVWDFEYETLLLFDPFFIDDLSVSLLLYSLEEVRCKLLRCLRLDEVDGLYWRRCLQPQPSLLLWCTDPSLNLLHDDKVDNGDIWNDNIEDGSSHSNNNWDISIAEWFIDTTRMVLNGSDWSPTSWFVLPTFSVAENCLLLILSYKQMLYLI